jgi:hypothetical protein
MPPIGSAAGPQQVTKNQQTMPTLKTITVYTFDELSEEAKKKAREWMRDHALDYDWWDFIYEDAASVGIKITGFDLGRASYCNGTIEDTESTAHAILKNHGEECETHKTASAYLKERDDAIEAAPRNEDGEFEDEGALDDKLGEIDGEFTKAILEDYRICLQREYEYRLSDEPIDQDILANEYLFTEEGRRSATL